MQVKVVTLKYSDGLGGFPDTPLTRAVSGREVLDVREHFFVYGNVPHLSLVLCLGGGVEGAGSGGGGRFPQGPREDPGKDLPENLQGLYRQLRDWRNDRAKAEGIPSYLIFRNVQLAEICKLLPGSLAELRVIDGIGEATCAKYGEALLSILPAQRKEGGASS